ncbi:unnamed protein product, partial [Meganyctiphanes norvegica]
MANIVLFWGGFLATTTIVTADGTIGELQTQDFDNAGSTVSDDYLTVSEEEIDYDDGNSIEERKSCSPTISCTRAGGYCVKSRKACNGTVDKNGCRGGKRCQCCLSDQTTPAPYITSTPCPTTGPTVPSNLTWHRVGRDRFVRFSQNMNWINARALCRRNGLDLYEPYNSTAIAIYLDDNFS